MDHPLAAETLKELVAEGLTIRQVSQRTGRSYTNVRFWLERHGVQTARQASRRIPPDQRPKHTTLTCSRHGETVFVLEGRGYYRCSKCRMAQVSSWRRRLKARLVAEAGGRCVLCSYDRYQGALEFHHRDPNQKEFALSMHGLTRSTERVRAEAAKCVLLCANCHAEVEGRFTTLSSPACQDV